MEIVIFSQLFFPENATINMAAHELVARGHSVRVMTGLPNAPGGKIFKGYGYFHRLRERWRGVDILRNWLIPRGSGSPLRLSINYLSYVFFASLGLWRLMGNRPDVILVNQLSPVTVALPAIFYKWIIRRPLAMWIHDLWPESVVASGATNNKLLLRIIGRLVNFIYRHCDLIFVQSEAMFGSVESRGVERDRIVFLPNPIDDYFRPLENAPRPASMQVIPENAFVIMFAGAIGSSQDIPTIIHAAERLKKHDDIHWAIVGDGRERPAAEKLVSSLGLEGRVHFLGGHPPDQMPFFYAHANVMLVTLRNEPIFALTVPLKTQTYMACGKPIICNVPGEAARIISKANCGFTAEPENPSALADAVYMAYTMWRTNGGLDELGRNGLKFFGRYYARERIMSTLETELRTLARTTGRD